MTYAKKETSGRCSRKLISLRSSLARCCFLTEDQLREVRAWQHSVFSQGCSMLLFHMCLCMMASPSPDIDSFFCVPGKGLVATEDFCQLNCFLDCQLIGRHTRKSSLGEELVLDVKEIILPELVNRKGSQIKSTYGLITDRTNAFGNHAPSCVPLR